ncbi:50S ribosomal protein L4 [candidate division GN15 bacterium]|nr:50S ribosomal protein L4 [candidate division GN15 bacterium]
MTTKVYNQDGAEVGSVDLKPEIFEIEPNEAVVHQYVVNYLAQQRQGTVNTKTRRQVRGGGRKPYRQKGTGNARRGTSRSPLIRGGGTIFGPHPRDHGSVFPKKMKRLAIRSVLSSKAKSDRIKVIDKFELPEIKTRTMADVLGKLELAGQKCLILDEGRNDNLVMSCRNIPKVSYRRAASTNGYEVLNADWLVITKAGLEKVEEVLS